MAAKREYTLGRIVQHDPRSKRYRVNVDGVEIQSVRWQRRVPVFDQGDLGSCHDAETEILTRRGWLPFADLTLDNEVATVNPSTAELSYERPTRVVQLPYDGDIHRVSNSRHDFMVTPNHMMLVRKWDERARALSSDYSLVPMCDLGWYSGLMESVHYAAPAASTYTLPGIPKYKRASQREDVAVDMHVWLNFLGIYLAEGTMIKGKNKIQIAASKEREKRFVRSILIALNVNALELKDRFTFQDARIYHALESLGLKGVYAFEKFVPDFVFDLPSHQILHLLEGHRQGDGSFQNGTWTHHTASVRLADDLQRLIFLAGGMTGRSIRAPRTSTMRNGRAIVGRHPAYAVRHLASTNSCIERKIDVSVEQYTGMVYCAEVPTHHTLVTRRNGKILIAGNCTANAAVGALATDPFYATLPSKKLVLDEALCVAVYSEATRLDDYDGEYPPTDTGSSGLGVAKSLAARGLISGYTHAFSLDDALKSLSTGPVIIGVNWYNNFFTPTKTGVLSVGKNDSVAGGHEVVLDEIDTTKNLVGGTNSWGESWGVNGRFYMSFDLLARLMFEDGDVTAFVPITAPAPVPDPEPLPDPFPVPTPAPIPVDDSDESLWAQVEKWSKAPHVRSNKKAAAAVRQWATSKGLM